MSRIQFRVSPSTKTNGTHSHDAASSPSPRSSCIKCETQTIWIQWHTFYGSPHLSPQCCFSSTSSFQILHICTLFEIKKFIHIRWGSYHFWGRARLWTDSTKKYTQNHTPYSWKVIAELIFYFPDIYANYVEKWPNKFVNISRLDQDYNSTGSKTLWALLIHIQNRNCKTTTTVCAINPMTLNKNENNKSKSASAEAECQMQKNTI